MKRSRIVFAIVSSVICLSEFAATAANAKTETSSLRVADLRTEHMVNPIGIGETTPLLTWQVRGAVQLNAYQVRVARTVEALRQGKLLWDSDKSS